MSLDKTLLGIAKSAVDTQQKSRDGRNVVSKGVDAVTNKSYANEDKKVAAAALRKWENSTWKPKVEAKLKQELKTRAPHLKPGSKAYQQTYDSLFNKNYKDLQSAKAKAQQQIGTLRQKGQTQRQVDNDYSQKEAARNNNTKLQAASSAARDTGEAVSGALATGSSRALRYPLQLAADIGENDDGGIFDRGAKALERHEDNLQQVYPAYADIQQNGNFGQKLALSAVEQIPNLALSFTGAGAAAKGAQLAGAGAKMTAATAYGTAAATMYPQAYGDGNDSTKQELENATPEQLRVAVRSKDIYKGHFDKNIKAGMSEDEAHQKSRDQTISSIAEESGDAVGLATLALSMIAPGVGSFTANQAAGGAVSKFGQKVFNKLAAKADAGKVAKYALPAAVGTGIVGLNVAEEALQEGYTDYKAQQAAVDVGVKDKINQPQLKEAMLMGGILGGAMGGGTYVGTRNSKFQQAQDGLREAQDTYAQAASIIPQLQQQIEEVSPRSAEGQALTTQLEETKAALSTMAAEAETRGIPKTSLARRAPRIDPTNSFDTDFNGQVDGATELSEQDFENALNPDGTPATQATPAAPVMSEQELDIQDAQLAEFIAEQHALDEAIEDGSNDKPVEQSLAEAQNWYDSKRGEGKQGLSGVVSRAAATEQDAAFAQQQEGIKGATASINDYIASERAKQQQIDAQLQQEAQAATTDEEKQAVAQKIEQRDTERAKEDDILEAREQLAQPYENELFDTTIIGADGAPFKLARFWDSSLPAGAKAKAIADAFGGQVDQNVAKSDWANLPEGVQKELHQWFTERLNGVRQSREGAVAQAGEQVAAPAVEQEQEVAPTGNGLTMPTQQAPSATTKRRTPSAGTVAQQEESLKKINEELKNYTPAASQLTDENPVINIPAPGSKAVNVATKPTVSSKVSQALIDKYGATKTYGREPWQLIGENDYGMPIYQHQNGERITQKASGDNLGAEAVTPDSYTVDAKELAKEHYTKEEVEAARERGQARADESKKSVAPTTEEGVYKSKPAAKAAIKKQNLDPKTTDIVQTDEGWELVESTPATRAQARVDSKNADREAQLADNDLLARNSQKATKKDGSPKYFLSDAKSQQFIVDNDIGATHEVVKNGNNFEIQPKQTTEANQTTEAKPLLINNTEASLVGEQSTPAKRAAAKKQASIINETTSETTTKQTQNDIKDIELAEQHGFNDSNRLDHGELSIPNRTNNIDSEIDSYKRDKAKLDAKKLDAVKAKNTEKAAAEKDRLLPIKEQAQVEYKQYGTAMVKAHKDKLDAKGVNARDFFRDEAKYNPEAFLKLSKKFQEEQQVKPTPSGDWRSQVGGNEIRDNKDGITVRKHDRVVHIRGANSIAANKKARELASQEIRELHYIAAKENPSDPFSEASIWLDGEGDMIRKKGTKKPSGALLPVLKLAKSNTKPQAPVAKPETVAASPVKPETAPEAKETAAKNKALAPQLQVDAVRKQYEGTDKWMKAPNGKKTKLTEQQWLQVRTPAFKEWFGDWEGDPENASKIMDDNGEPMVVYHGSPTKDISVFRASPQTNGLLFFTKDKSDAVSYSNGEKVGYLEMGDAEDKVNLDLAREYIIEQGGDDLFDGVLLRTGISDKSKVYEYAFESNIGTVESIGAKLRSGEIELSDAINQINNFTNSLYKDGEVYGVFLNSSTPYNSESNPISWREAEVIGAKKLTETSDGVFVTEDDYSAIAIYNPNQIKSATANAGTFDNSNPDIRYSKTNPAKGNTGTTAKQVVSILQKRFGKEVVAALIKSGKLRVRSLNDFVNADGRLLIPSDAEGFYYDGKVTLIADNLTPETVVATLLHEMGGHAGIQNMLETQTYMSLMENFYDLVRSGNKYAVRAKERAEASAYSDSEARDEYIPYLITEYAQATERGDPLAVIKRFINRVVAGVRAWVNTNTGVQLKITPNDITQLAERMVKRLAEQSASDMTVAGIENMTAAQMQFSQESVQQANTPVFREWFDANTPDIRFSRRYSTLGTDGKPVTAKEKARDRVALAQATTMSSKFGVNLLLRRHLATPQHVALLNPVFKVFTDNVQARIAYENNEAGLVQTYLPEIWDTRLVVGKKKEAMERVSKAIFDGTMADKVWDDNELQTMFDLTDKDINFYRRARQAIDGSVLNMTVDTLSALAKGTKLVSLPTVQRLKLAGLTPIGHNLMLQQHMTDELERLAKGGLITPKAEARMQKQLDAVFDVMSAVAGKYDKLVEDGYAPLMRFGHYAVEVRDKVSNDLDLFELYETKGQQRKAIKELKERYDESQFTIGTGTLNPEGFKQFKDKGLSPETVQLFAAELGLDDDGAYQAYLKIAVSDRSALKRLIHRKKVPGYSEDMPRVLSSFVMSNARYSGRSLYNNEIERSIQDIEDGNLQNEAQKVFENMENPQEEFAQQRSLMFHYFMGFSPAFFLLNLTQPFTQTIPKLTAYAGIVKGHAYMAQALGIVGKNMGSSAINMGKKAAGMPTPNWRGFEDNLPAWVKKEDYLRMAREGHLDPQNIYMIKGLERGKGGVASGVWGNIESAAGWFAEVSESINRRSTMIAAFRVAKDMGDTNLKAEGFDNAYDFAVSVIQQTQGIYNKANRSGLARGNGKLGQYGPLILVFKQFTINYTEQMIRHGRDKEVKSLAVAMMWQFALAGMLGLPFADDLRDIFEGIAYRVFGKAFNLPDYLQEKLGKSNADALMYGIASEKGRIDLFGRSSLGNVIPGTDVIRPGPTDWGEILGASSGFYESFFSAASMAADGKYKDALITASPRYIRDAASGAEIALTGSYRNTKGDKIMDLDKTDAVIKTLAFNPSNNAKPGRDRSNSYNMKNMLKAKTDYFSKHLAEAIYQENDERVDELYNEMDEWNDSNAEHFNVDIDKIEKSAEKRVERKDFGSAERQNIQDSLALRQEELAGT